MCNIYLSLARHKTLPFTFLAKILPITSRMLITVWFLFARAFSNLSSHERYFKIKQTFAVNDVDISLDSVYLRLISKRSENPKGVSASSFKCKRGCEDER